MRRLLAILPAVALLSLVPIPAPAGTPARPPLERVRPSPDGDHFIQAASGRRFVPRGVNYDHDHAGRLLEDYWADEWDTVAADLREIKALGANIVRVHLQLGRFLPEPDRPDPAQLDRLARLVRLAGELGLYLDLTGLGCYHEADTPAWYHVLDEAGRWDAQARFWSAVAGACRGNPAVFCYDLMNEPIVSAGPGADPRDWTPGPPLGGKQFVQRITLTPGDRPASEIAAAWVVRLSSAVRAADPDAMITVGVIPWAFTFEGARPLFHGPEAGRPLDFVAIHLYPEAGKIDEQLKTLEVYDVGKPLLIEECFPLRAGIGETANFLARASPPADGCLTFYWGRTIDECRTDGDLKGAILADWLEAFFGRKPPDAGDR